MLRAGRRRSDRAGGFFFGSLQVCHLAAFWLSKSYALVNRKASFGSFGGIIGRHQKNMNRNYLEIPRREKTAKHSALLWTPSLSWFWRAHLMLGVFNHLESPTTRLWVKTGCPKKPIKRKHEETLWFLRLFFFTYSQFF